jgi:hypothetical protein
MSSSLNRPSPPALPREQQLEFEKLYRAAQTPLAPTSSASSSFSPSSSSSAEADLAIHPDAREPLKPEFEGDVNPSTGERGGPKREPVGQWGAEGDWSFKGRVSDF